MCHNCLLTSIMCWLYPKILMVQPIARPATKIVLVVDRAVIEKQTCV